MHHIVASAGVFESDVDEPVEVAGMTPCFVEQFEEHKLRKSAWVLHRDLGGADEALDDLFRGCDPACAGAGGDGFGKGVEAHDAAVDVEAEEGRDESRDEFVVRGWWGDVRCVGPCVGLHLEEEVGLVFEDVEVVLLS